MRLLVLFFLCLCCSGCAYYFGNAWQKSFDRIPETAFPAFSDHPSRLSDTELQDHPLVLHWAAEPFQPFGQKEKTGSPRVILAKLLAKKDIKDVNEHLLSLQPWGNSGTSGALNPKGDYDFTTILLAAVLYRFQNDTNVLWKWTSDHIANVLLIEEGGKPHTKTPRTMCIMKDTENHILMTNISQYLKNQWMKEHGSVDPKHDNLANGMEKFLLELLAEFRTTGPYEFNAKPYEGYTISALLVMQSYVASPKLNESVTQTLDQLAWEYMLTSYKFRESSPFRRRLERANGPSVSDNAMTSMMHAWFLEHEKGVFAKEAIEHNLHQAFSALIFDYRPPATLWNCDEKPKFIRIGHGHQSSPEVYGRGKGWMLSAGGFQRGESSQIIARPIVLLLDDGASELKDCFYISGKGKFTKWNNTGVYERVAVVNGSVHVPERFKPTAEVGDWTLYRQNGLRIVVYSTGQLGLIYIPNDEDLAKTNDSDLLKVLAEKNMLDKDEFIGLDGKTIGFNLKAKRGRWVIQYTTDNSILDNRTDKWPRVVIEPMR